MKLEYLADDSPDRPLIRLYDFTAAEAERLREVVIDLAARATDRVDVHRLPNVEAIDECRLTLFRTAWDQGVICKLEATTFDCGLTASTWENVAGLIEPFLAGGDGHQWLVGVPGEAALLLSASVDGQW